MRGKSKVFAVLDHFGAVIHLTETPAETFESEDFHCVAVSSLEELKQAMENQYKIGTSDFIPWFRRLLNEDILSSSQGDAISGTKT